MCKVRDYIENLDSERVSFDTAPLTSCFGQILSKKCSKPRRYVIVSKEHAEWSMLNVLGSSTLPSTKNKLVVIPCLHFPQVTWKVRGRWCEPLSLLTAKAHLLSFSSFHNCYHHKGRLTGTRLPCVYFSIRCFKDAERETHTEHRTLPFSFYHIIYICNFFEPLKHDKMGASRSSSLFSGHCLPRTTVHSAKKHPKTRTGA